MQEFHWYRPMYAKKRGHKTYCCATESVKITCTCSYAKENSSRIRAGHYQEIYSWYYALCKFTCMCKTLELCVHTMHFFRVDIKCVCFDLTPPVQKLKHTGDIVCTQHEQFPSPVEWCGVTGHQKQHRWLTMNTLWDKKRSLIVFRVVGCVAYTSQW